MTEVLATCKRLIAIFLVQILEFRCKAKAAIPMVSMVKSAALVLDWVVVVYRRVQLDYAAHSCYIAKLWEVSARCSVHKAARAKPVDNNVESLVLLPWRKAREWLCRAKEASPSIRCGGGSGAGRRSADDVIDAKNCKCLKTCK